MIRALEDIKSNHDGFTSNNEPIKKVCAPHHKHTRGRTTSNHINECQTTLHIIWIKRPIITSKPIESILKQWFCSPNDPGANPSTTHLRTATAVASNPSTPLRRAPPETNLTCGEEPSKKIWAMAQSSKCAVWEATIMSSMLG